MTKLQNKTPYRNIMRLPLEKTIYSLKNTLDIHSNDLLENNTIDCLCWDGFKGNRQR
jgi:hypothetical protein